MISAESVKLSLSFKLFILAIIFIYLDFLRNAFDVTGVFFPASIRSVSVMLGPIVLYLSIGVALYEGQLTRIKPFYRVWMVLLLFYYCFLLAIGIFAFKNELRYVIFDLMGLAFVFSGLLMGCKNENWEIFDKVIYVIFLINVIACLYWVGGYARYIIDSRSLIITAFNQTPYFFWGMLSVWPYFLLTIKNKNNLRRIVTIGGIILYFVFAIIFLKRAPFAYLFAFLFLLYWKKPNFKEWAKLLTVFGLGAALLWPAFQYYSAGEALTIVDNLSKRFNRTDGVVNTVIKTDRLTYDPVIVATQFQGIEYIIGRGLGGVVNDVEGYYPENVVSRMHNGSALTVLKGGLLLLILWVVGWLFVAKEYFIHRVQSLDQYYIPLLIPILFIWIFGFVNSSVSFLLLMMCAGRVMSNYKGDITVHPLVGKTTFRP